MTINPWRPHVYIMQCVVNEALVPTLAELRQPWASEPEWMGSVRRLAASVASPWELYSEMPRPDWLAILRGRPFVKIGSSYQENPSLRTRALAEDRAPKVTMTCHGVPVAGKRVLAYVPGEESLERALHERWFGHRIDDSREFFWTNPEMLELVTAWRGIDPMGEFDPFLTSAARVTWWENPPKGVSEW